MKTPTACLAFLLVLAPLALADGGTLESQRYYAGLRNGLVGGVCTGDVPVIPNEPSVGGACGLPLHSAVAALAVEDDRVGHVPFHYVGIDAAGDACGPIQGAASPAVATFPAGCVEVRVFVDAGSLVGTITVTS